MITYFVEYQCSKSNQRFNGILEFDSKIPYTIKREAEQIVRRLVRKCHRSPRVAAMMVRGQVSEIERLWLSGSPIDVRERSPQVERRLARTRIDAPH